MTLFLLLPVLADEQNARKRAALSGKHFLRDHLVVFLEGGTTVRIANEHMLDIEVHQLFCADLASIGALLLVAEILTCNLNLRVKQGLGGSDVDTDRRDDDLKFFFVKLGFVEHVVDEILNRLHAAVT